MMIVHIFFTIFLPQKGITKGWSESKASVCYRLYFRIKKAVSKFTGIKKAALDTRGGDFCIGK
jgi:hypothetical protein